MFVLFVDPPGYQYGQAPKGRYMAKLQACAEQLAPRLLAQDDIAASVRRIAGVGLHIDSTGSVAAEVRWAWSSPSAAEG